MAETSFWFVIAMTVLSAGIVVLSNQLIYSAMALLFTLFGVAGIYVFLWADFIAGVQLLVYIGGILVLIIFGIMLTNRISSVRLSQTNVQQGISSIPCLSCARNTAVLNSNCEKSTSRIRPPSNLETTTLRIGKVPPRG